MTATPTTDETIAQAARHWRQGGLVAFPTETVYGLGADACQPAAVAGIFTLKQRPATHPLIVHLPDGPEWLDRFLLNEAGQALAQAFWPGPLTLVVPRPDWLPKDATGGRDTVGIRIPSHPTAQALLQAFNGPVAAPSANRFGQVSPTLAAHVRQAFDTSQLPWVIDGGPCQIGLESTIVDVTQPAAIRLLRPGHISVDQLQACLNQPIHQPVWQVPTHQTEQAPSAGTLSRHYCPAKPLKLVAASQWQQALAQTATTQGVFAWGFHPPLDSAKGVHYDQAPDEPLSYGRQLYARLHDLDAQPHLTCLLIECPPLTPPWQAIHDRLTRATSPL